VREQLLLKAHQTKGHEARTVRLNAQAQTQIERYLRSIDHDSNQPLFISRANMRFSPNSLVQVFGRIFKAFSRHGNIALNEAQFIWRIKV
jgi:site-specific recombinase XerD